MTFLRLLREVKCQGTITEIWRERQIQSVTAKIYLSGVQATRAINWS